DRIFNELSGGERQRALLALPLAQESGLVLLDEPTAHLDIKHQIEVLELLRRLNRERGLTVLAVLHDLNLAARYFPRLVLFNRRVIADGPPAQVLDAGLLERVYETPVQVGILRGEEHLSVLPPGYAPAAISGDAEPAARMVHVLAGGGSGELMMRALADAGIPFSAGPLNVGDSDYALARRLAAVCYAEPPYAPVSPQGLAAARERMGQARAVVVCPAPLGPGNVSLLDAALQALRAGAEVILLEPGDLAESSPAVDLETVRERDFSGRGVELYSELMKDGARQARSPLEVVQLLAI
ncbi:MAG TPA: ATP-binding cassette domain-containing protein, partial [Ktedonobacterales bacterium]